MVSPHEVLKLSISMVCQEEFEIETGCFTYLDIVNNNPLRVHR